jgi:hypothetical protein|tara:strand:+ start:638 stop:832 length:195 start_codon:yes stop_codon:yes gene_type:complete
MIPYTQDEMDWISYPEHRMSKKKRVSNLTADGQPPKQKDLRKHDWAIKTTIEVDGKQYIVPVQV